MTYRILAYLIGLALGYWVLTLAAKEKGGNQKLGKVIGWVIIVVSLVGPLCLAGSCFYCSSHPYSCPLSMGCPMDGQGHMMGGWNGPDHKPDASAADKSK